MNLRTLLGFCILAASAPAQAAVVERGYLPLSDGTLLNYTLTRPEATGRYPTVLKYGPYAEGVTSDPTWNDAGYAMLGVNIRGTGCSYGTFHVVRGDEWGADGAEVVAWAASQPWSDGTLGMIGYSFTGTSQLATAAFAGEHLKAIAPGDVFPDFYRDIVYPGGVINQWLNAWILVRAVLLGADTLDEAVTEPDCTLGVLQSQVPNDAQTLDFVMHPFLDDYWAMQPATFLDRVKVPLLGCVNWQDTTVYSRSASMFRDQLNPETTWMVGSNGSHTDCPISRARLLRFFDRYLKQQNNNWESTPHVLLIHELAGTSGVRETLNDDAGAWQTGYAHWSDFAAAIAPLTFYLHSGGQLQLQPAKDAASESYRYPLTSRNTPGDFGGTSNFAAAPIPGGALVYTTPALTQDLEFAGSGSANLWIESTATDADVQVTLTEVRPDGQEMFVQNGWLKLSHRKLDEAKSTALWPLHTDRAEDARAMPAGEAVLARVEVQPFNHVFRAGSALRLSVDAPGHWMTPVAAPATNTLHLGADQASELVLGWVAAGRAQTPLPACGTLLNQPCRASTASVPPGKLDIHSDDAAGQTPERRLRSRDGGCTAGGGHYDPLWLAMLTLAFARLVVRARHSRR
ncbi:MAG: CocE/NonD family hydrolase [Nevskiales bacterium]